MAHQSSQMRAGPSAYSLIEEPADAYAHHDKPEEHVDTSPSDQQPPGVDDDIDYNSLEEALTS